MDDFLAVPRERDLPAKDARHRHLVREVRGPTSDQRGHRLSRRYVVAAVAVAAVALLATPAFGLGSRIVDLFNGAPNGPQINASQAQRLLSTPAAGRQVALWQAPTTAGGKCVFLQLYSGAAPTTPSDNGGGLCDTGASMPQTAPIQTFVNWFASGNGDFSVVTDGRVSPSSGIASVKLVSGASTTPLQFRAGYFLGQIGASSNAGALPISTGPYSIVGYDGAGNEVARVDLQQLIANSSP